jgi:hypothetical protein
MPNPNYRKYLDVYASVNEILRFTMQDVFIPVVCRSPLTDREVGRIARTLLPKLARELAKKEPTK